MIPLREAAGIEGLIVLGVIYFILSMLQKAGEKARRMSTPPTPRPVERDEESATQAEGLSLEGILREIEKVKAERRSESEGARPPARPPRPEPRQFPQAPRPRAPERPAPKPRPSSVTRRAPVETTERGPLGRRGRSRLESAEEVEERTSLEDQGSLEVAESLEILDETRLRPARRVVDSDDSAEAVVQRRIAAAEARNRPRTDADHRDFHQRLAQGEAAAGAAQRHPTQRLRDAFVWREILGPPKALE